MKYILSVLLLLSATCAYAFPHTITSPAYTFGDRINIRSKPDIESGILNTIPVGTLLKVIQNTKIIYMDSGLTDYWYKISCNPYGKGDITGYVWGGYISNQSFSIDVTNEGVKELVLVKNLTQGIYSDQVKDASNDSQRGRSDLLIRIIKNRTVINELYPDHTGEAGRFDIRIFKPKGFNPPLTFLCISYCVSGETSESYNTLHVISGNDLFQALSLRSGGEGGYGSFSEAVFPGDKGGKPNRILVKTTDFTPDSETTETVEYLYDVETFRFEAQ